MRYLVLFISLIIITVMAVWFFNSSNSIAGTSNNETPAEIINATKNVAFKQCLASCASLLDEDRTDCESNCYNQ